VVAKNSGNGALIMLEQNHGGNQEAVKSTAIRVRDTGKIVTNVTRKRVPRSSKGGAVETATVTTTVTVTVTGTVTAFRPAAS
jgi:hypothetical protein